LTVRLHPGPDTDPNAGFRLEFGNIAVIAFGLSDFIFVIVDVAANANNDQRGID